MDTKNLVVALVKAEAHSPALDREIALLTGYKPRAGSKTGEEFWTSPSNVVVMKLPQFTLNLQDAIDLALSLSIKGGGFSWEGGKGHAKIGDDRMMHASSPALALCAAIVYHLAMRKDQ